jgi:hypothetical protein
VRVLTVSVREKLDKNLKENLTILKQPNCEFVIYRTTNVMGAVGALFVLACSVNFSQSGGCTKLSGDGRPAGSMRGAAKQPRLFVLGKNNLTLILLMWRIW